MANWALPLTVLLLSIFLRGPVVRLSFRPFKKLAEKRGSILPAELERGFDRPLRVLMIAAGIYAALYLSPLAPHGGTFRTLEDKCFRSVLILLLAWGLCRLSDSRELTETAFFKILDSKSDGVLLPFVSKILRFLISALAVLIVAQEWNFSISGLLAGLGLGGLAFALAAQDMLSNLFGGLVIFLDRPFGIGDWIQTDDVEGTVEDINFRSVKVRTFAQAIVTIPNSRLADRPVTNYSRMGKRRVSFTVGLKYGTTERQMRACTGRIRETLLKSPDIDPQTVVVTFDSLGESSLNFMLYFFTKTTDWQEHLRIREEVYYAVLRILEQEKAELAFPTRTVQIERQAD